MFNKTELNEKLTAELRELAKAHGILNADALRKAELVEIISQIKAQETDSTVTEAPISVKTPKAKLTKSNANTNPASTWPLGLLATAFLAAWL